VAPGFVVMCFSRGAVKNGGGRDAGLSSGFGLDFSANTGGETKLKLT